MCLTGTFPPTPDCTGCAHRVPLLHQLSAGYRGDGDVDQADIAALVLLPLPVGVFVQVQRDGIDGGEAAEVEVLAPEDVVRLQLAGGPGVQAVVQTQLTEVPAEHEACLTTSWNGTCSRGAHTFI